MQARVDAALEAKAASGPAARESAGALMDRQPTPGSIAAAEERLGDLSAQTTEVVAQGLVGQRGRQERMRTGTRRGAAGDQPLDPSDG